MTRRGEGLSKYYAEFWSPDFKFNSPTVQAKAQDLARSNKVALATYYGWYMPVFGLYSNIVDLDAVNPHYTPSYPIFNIIYWIMLAMVVIIIFVIVGRLLRDY
ncbi:MAG: DUF1523 family protein [Pseudomonadota bacterium]|nr:DUF1523 family protein [Pseudomonadota bacterium]